MSILLAVISFFSVCVCALFLISSIYFFSCCHRLMITTAAPVFHSLAPFRDNSCMLLSLFPHAWIDSLFFWCVALLISLCVYSHLCLLCLRSGILFTFVATSLSCAPFSFISLTHTLSSCGTSCHNSSDALLLCFASLRKTSFLFTL